MTLGYKPERSPEQRKRDMDEADRQDKYMKTRSEWKKESQEKDFEHVAELANKHFRPSGERGFHHSDMHKAAEEMRMEGKGSEDPMYPNSKKNK